MCGAKAAGLRKSKAVAASFLRRRKGGAWPTLGGEVTFGRGQASVSAATVERLRVGHMQPTRHKLLATAELPRVGPL